MSNESGKPDWAMNKRERANAERVAQGLAPKKRRRWPWAVGVLVIAGAAGGWFVQSGKLEEMRATRQAAETEAAAEAADRAARAAIIQLAPYEVVTLKQTTLAETLKITGSLAPVRQLRMSAEVSGRLDTVKVREGDTVRAGDVLVEFDTETLDSQLAQATANAEATRVQLGQARTDFERTSDLVQRGLSATNNLDRARTTLDQLTATLAAQETLVANAQRARDRSVVTAPFDGVISDRMVDPGQFVGTGTQLVTLVDMTSLEVEATAPVSYAPELAPGQVVEISVEGFGDRRFDGRVDRLSPVAIEGSRMLPVFVAIDNKTGELRGGMFASGRIVLEARAEGLAVPAGALRQDADGAHVLVIEAGKAVRRDVEVVRSWDGGALLEVVAGLAAGDVVVAEPLPALRAGDAVALMGAVE